MRNTSDTGPSHRDAHQRLRMTRHLMAVGSSMLVIALLCAYWLEGYIPQQAFTVSVAAISLLCVVFYVLFRTHLNTRFNDRSLTMPQIGSALVVLVYANFHLVQGRGAFLLVYIMALLFAVFRLTSRQLLILTLPVLAAHGVMVGERALAGRANIGIELLQWIVLTVVLLWFVQLGGYISRMRETLRSLVIRDELTGAYSRRHMLDTLAAEKARADRRGGTFTVAMLDIDRFKAVNDRFGHDGGDVVLRAFAELAERAIRKSDSFGRYGGEEFLLVLPDTTAVEAGVLLERMREETRRSAGAGLPEPYVVTVSVGVREYKAREELEAALKDADEALYEAKNSGRDRIITAAK